MYIKSETIFLLNLIKSILLLPLTAIQVIFRRKRISDLLDPIRIVSEFAYSAKVTFYIMLTIFAVYISEIFMSDTLLSSLIFRPEHIYSLNLIPIVASWFLHASWAHLLGNLIFLFIFGRIVENRLGRSRFILVYFGSAIISSLIAGYFGQGGIGASGAIAGIIATAILLAPFYFTYIMIIPLPIFIVGWLAILADITGVIVPADDNIGHIAHLGGYFAVTILVFLFNRNDRQIAKKGLLVNLVMLVLWILAYYSGIVENIISILAFA